MVRGLLLLVASAIAANYDHLRYSVVRIQSVASSFNIMMPFQAGGGSMGVGSGWVAKGGDDPLLVTNAHVVKDGHQVSIQLLVLGEQSFPVDVVTICTKFDLALLKFKNPKAFLNVLSAQGMKLEALTLATTPPAMGAEVVALGFPLGQETMKISKGVVAGNEEVNGVISLQSTAAISPGNSGGPLLTEDGKTVVGVNFAKSARKHADGVNFVIPAWRVTQILHQYENSGKTNMSPPPRINARFAPTGLNLIEGNPALYALGGKSCMEGMFVSNIVNKSSFGTADPPVKEQAFLTHVNGVKLDRFGMGRNTDYAQDYVGWKDLMWMTKRVDTPVEVTTCYQGTTTKHKVSLLWKDSYKSAIDFLEEPAFEKIPYELFGDVGVMQMTVNHVMQLLQTTGNPATTRWLYPGLDEPRLVVNYVKGGSYASEFLSVGSVVTKVNGVEVKTLADFAKAFVPAGAKGKPSLLQGDGPVWTLETDMGQLYAAMYYDTLKGQLAFGRSAPWALTPAVRAAAHGSSLLDAGEQAAQQEEAAEQQDLAVVARGPLEVAEGGWTVEAAAVQALLQQEGVVDEPDYEL